jgi:hypothetical protein
MPAAPQSCWRPGQVTVSNAATESVLPRNSASWIVAHMAIIAG